MDMIHLYMYILYKTIKLSMLFGGAGLVLGLMGITMGF